MGPICLFLIPVVAGAEAPGSFVYRNFTEIFPSQLTTDKGGCRQAPALYKSPFMSEVKCISYKSVIYR